MKFFSDILSELLIEERVFDEVLDEWARPGNGHVRAWLLDGLNDELRGHLDNDANTVGGWERLCTTIFGDQLAIIAARKGRPVEPRAVRGPLDGARAPGWIASRAHMRFHSQQA